MGDLLWQKRIIKVKAESVKGTQVEADQAIQTENLLINPTSEAIERAATGLYVGHAAPSVIGAYSGICTFATEMRSNGSTGLEAGLAILLQGSGFSKSTETYSMHSTPANQTCLSVDAWEDGKKKRLYGCMGRVVFEGNVGERFMCNFEYEGVWSAPTDEAMPAFAPSTATPMILQGGTFTIGATATKISSLRLDMQNQVVARRDANATGGIAYYLITNCKPILGIDPEGQLVATTDIYGARLAGTEAAVSLVLTDGTVNVTFTIPKFQYTDVQEVDLDGVLHYDVTGQLNHDSGNDAVQIVAAAA